MFLVFYNSINVKRNIYICNFHLYFMKHWAYTLDGILNCVLKILFLQISLCICLIYVIFTNGGKSTVFYFICQVHGFQNVLGLGHVSGLYDVKVV